VCVAETGAVTGSGAAADAAIAHDTIVTAATSARSIRGSRRIDILRHPWRSLREAKRSA
jgi:hypothetical protein